MVPKTHRIDASSILLRRCNNCILHLTPRRVRLAVRGPELMSLISLIVQGVLKTPLVEVADIVLPGAAWVEKDATFTNMTDHIQGSARVIPPRTWSVTRSYDLATS